MSKPSTYQEKLSCHACDGQMDGGKWKIEQYSVRPETAKSLYRKFLQEETKRAVDP